MSTAFDSGNVSVNANLGAGEAYHLAAGHAATPGLELVSLSFGGSALKVTQGGGLGDLRIDANIQQSVGAAGLLYYKDGSAPTSNTDGTIITWSNGPNWSGNNYTAMWHSGAVVDAPEDRYFWIRPGSATNITSGTVRVRFDYTQDLDFASAPPAYIDLVEDISISGVILPEGEHGSGTYTYTLAPLPAGVSFNASTRRPTGTPSEHGNTTAVYTVNDGTDTKTANIVFRVARPLAFKTAPPTEIVLTVGEQLTGVTLPEGEHGSGGYTYDFTSLPAGISFDAATRQPTGVVNTPGDTTAVYSVTDGTSTITANIVFRVQAAPTLNLNVDFNTATSGILTWDAYMDATGYEVNVSEGPALGTTWIPTGNTRTRHLVKHLKRGTQYTFAVRGVNGNVPGPASSPVTGRTPIASLHNALFFKECVNYLEDGARVSEHGNAANIIRAVADNDYRTFSTETDYDINIAVNGDPTRVDAVFVKGIGIEGHSAVPTGGSGVGYSNRRMPATVKNWEGTDVSTIVNGFQHDLYLLDAHFTATRVRLTFTGTDVKIVEVMLLEFGIEIDANGDFTEINPDFVDRIGEIHSAPGGSLGYGSPLSAARDKWEIDYAVKVVPGKTLLQTPEEFLYWRSENRNHVHAQEPSRFPWRIFPATFVGERVPVRYRTDDKLSGEILTFSVSEQ